MQVSLGNTRCSNLQVNSLKETAAFATTLSKNCWHGWDCWARSRSWHFSTTMDLPPDDGRRTNKRAACLKTTPEKKTIRCQPSEYSGRGNLWLLTKLLRNFTTYSLVSKKKFLQLNCFLGQSRESINAFWQPSLRTKPCYWWAGIDADLMSLRNSIGC